MEPTKSNNRRIDISACLEAVSHYDATAHLERDGSEDYIEPEYVFRWEHFLANVEKNGTYLLGLGCFCITWIACLIFVMSIFQNYSDYQAAPAQTLGSSSPTPIHEGAGYISIYAMSLIAACVSYLVGSFLLQQAKESRPTISILSADTGHLPAVDTLVRASAEPIQPQKAMLLRPAVERAERHEEQLLRASARQE